DDLGEWTDFSTEYANIARSIFAELNYGAESSYDGLVYTGDDVEVDLIDNEHINVGIYTAIAIGLKGQDAINYEIIGILTQEWRITKARITNIYIEDATYTYDKNSHSIVVNTTYTQYNDPMVVYYEGVSNGYGSSYIDGNTATNAGVYTITAKIDETANYEAWSDTAILTINTRDIGNITMSDLDAVYNAQAHSISINTTITALGEEIVPVYEITDSLNNTVASNSAINAGLYTVKAIISPENIVNANYSELILTAILYIDKATITYDEVIITGEGIFTYKADYYCVKVELMNNSVVNVTQYGDEIQGSYEGGTNETKDGAKDVGTYSFVFTATSTNNYYEYVSPRMTLVIEPKQLNLDWAEISHTYDAEAHNDMLLPSLLSGASLDDDGRYYDSDIVNVQITVLGTGIGEAASGQNVFRNAGQYTVTASIDNTNYTLANAINNYVIEKAEITGWQLNDYTVEYNNTLWHIGVSRSSDIVQNEVSSVALLGGDIGTVTYMYNTINLETPFDTEFSGARYAGNYYIQATISESTGNYVNFADTAIIEITPTNLTGYTVNNVSVVFDGAIHKIVAQVVSSQYIDGVYYTQYNEELTLTYEISNDGGSVYTTGNSAVNVNIINGEVASYRIKVTFKVVNSEAEQSYTALIQYAELTIAQASLAGLSMEDDTKVYDGKEHSLTLNTPAPPETGYPIYNVVDNKLIVILSSTHNLVNGTPMGDTFDINQTGGGAVVDAGTYTYTIAIDASGDTIATNYVPFVGLSADLVIERAEISTDTDIFFEDASQVYTAEPWFILFSQTKESSVATKVPVMTWQVHPSTNLDHTDTIDIDYQCDFATFTGAIKAGVYVITATLSNPNYIAKQLTATLTIEKATINKYLTGASLVFDEATHYVGLSDTPDTYNDSQVTSINLLGADTATVSYIHTYALPNGEPGQELPFLGGVNAGTYVVTAIITVDGEASVNYHDWESQTVTLTIHPYQATVSWVGTSYEYIFNGTDQGVSIFASFQTVSGVTRDLAVSFTGISGKANGDSVFMNAGDYQVEAIYENNNAVNYDFGYSATVILNMAKATIQRYLVGTTQTYTSTPYYLLINSINAANLVTSYEDGVTNVINVMNESITIIYTYTPIDANNGLDSAIGVKNAGSYLVTAQLDLGEDESNFNTWETPLSATLEINKVNLINTGGVFTKVYDGTTNLTLGTLTGICENDQNLIAYSGEYADKNVGYNKTININFKIKDEITSEFGDKYDYILDNYILPSLTSGVITERTLVLQEGLNWTKEYDGTNDSVNNENLEFVPDNDIVVINGQEDDITVTAFYNSRHVLEATTIVFALTGSDASNYIINNLTLRTTEQLENGEYLILPKTTGITWNNYEKVYNGLTQAVTAYISVVGQDVTLENNGQYELTLSMLYTHNYQNGVLTEISPYVEAVFRNAGKYIATVDSALDANMAANYGIVSTTQICTITQATASINWKGYTASYTYNGKDQRSSLSVEVILLGEDVDIYEGNTSCMSFEFINNETGLPSEEFRNAGEYTYTVIFNDEDLINNYILSDNVRNITMERAEITNIKFEGIDSWYYYYGEYKYFFITSVNNITGFNYSNDAKTGYIEYYYQFDQDLAIQVEYNGGAYAHEYVTGNNGVRNVNNYTIYATVAQTENYKYWEGSITVNIMRTSIVDYIYMVGYATYYDGLPHYVYASNTPDEPQTSSVIVRLPDGSEASVLYYTMVVEYANPNFTEEYYLDWGTNSNYAVNAGSYIMSAKIESDNYLTWSVDYVPLLIQPKEVDIHWTYDGQETPDYTYNATDQTDTITAIIYRAGDTDETNRIIRLEVSVVLDNDTLDPSLEPLKRFFILAGDYTLSANFRANDIEREAHINNYVLNADSLGKEVTMKQFEVDIKWSYGCSCEHEDTLYNDADPCIYDGTYHRITANGYGIGDAIMEIVTVGDFLGKNAGNYHAFIESIVEAYDSISIDSTVYSMPYSMNYKLPENVYLQWRITRRPLSLGIDAENSHLSKIYDDSAAFTLGTATHESETIGNLSKLYFTYNVTDIAANGQPNKVVYTIGNIIAGDEDVLTLLVTSIVANVPSIAATSAVLTFGELTFSESAQNYYIDGNITGLTFIADNIITPREITVTIESGFGHVYNGQTLEANFDETNHIYRVSDVNALFTMTDTNTGVNINELLSNHCQNYFYGNFNINGAIEAGLHNFNGWLTTRDQDGVANYDVTLNMPNEYRIEERKIYIDYNNLLQSIFKEHLNVTGEVVTSLSDLTDMEWGIDGYATMDPSEQFERKRMALLELIAADGFDFEIINGWQAVAHEFTKYTAIIGSEGSELLTVAKKGTRKDSYAIEYPVLQLTYLSIIDEDLYLFEVRTIDDLMRLEFDVEGLREVRAQTGVGVAPTYYQVANISGIREDGSYVTFKPIANFEGTYYGNGYVISDISIVGNAKFQDIENAPQFVGLFANANNAVIQGVKVINGSVYASSSALYIGGIAGLVENSMLIQNTFQGYVLAYDIEESIEIGGIVGRAVDSQVTSNMAVGYIKAYSDKGIRAGGILGAYSILLEDPDRDTIIADNTSFMEITAVAGDTVQSSAGGVVGFIEDLEVYYFTDAPNSYLANSIYLNGSTLAHSIGNYTDTTGATTYDEYAQQDGEVINLVNTYVIRHYLLPNGNVGTSDNVIEITNYRQLSLLRLYSFANFSMSSDIYFPSSYIFNAYEEGFYGTLIVTNDAKIYISKTSDSLLFKAGNITVYHEN
ncbi:MAG: hypothetical protein GX242_01025, partial [Clostridiales bacterium]|nr:hypothetical protein [Clostridiales bacterium]